MCSDRDRFLQLKSSCQKVKVVSVASSECKVKSKIQDSNTNVAQLRKVRYYTIESESQCIFLIVSLV